MKKLFMLVGLILCFQQGVSQQDIVQRTREQVDSLLHLIDLEKQPEKRFELILKIYDTPLEGYPLLILETFQKLLVIGEKNNDIISKSNAYSFAGQGYRLTASYVKALAYHHKAIALAEQSGNVSVLAWSQNQIGHIYKDREENEKAIGFYKASVKNSLRGEFKDLEGWAMMNLSAVYLTANQPDSCLYYGKLAYDRVVKSIGFETQATYIYSNMASAYSKLGDMANARAYYREVVRLANASPSPRYKGIAYVSYAEHFQRNNQRDSAILFARKAIVAVQGSLFGYMALKPSRMLMDMYEGSNSDSTIKYLRIFRAANDSLNNTRANQQLQVLTFEEDQRQRDIAAEKINYQNKLKMNLLLVGLGVCCVFALILYRNNKQKQKTNKVLEQTLADLKSTQSQLIQSEKMASLGELAAGIAHEIQNPLNFVNNFSEVSTELIEEMKSELAKGEFDQAKSISEDLKQNLEKISHHGKRADAIVKGMLQHSRTRSTQKELTDLNALTDEYLRLAYHGLRAKDKSFNASFETNLDASLPKINVVPQDIGRVILNLINNAFYAVNEKQKSADTGYKPTVMVSSGFSLSPERGMSEEQGEGKIEISIRDNGNGIPEKIKDKIFQPFFTTKPTGQGTGLGLSLAYDIIKAHGGKLKVESKPGSGTEFIIQLPIAYA